MHIYKSKSNVYRKVKTTNNLKQREYKWMLLHSSHGPICIYSVKGQINKIVQAQDINIVCWIRLIGGRGDCYAT
jgi:hypothetical protein